MKLVDMKLPKKTKEELKKENMPYCGDGEKYPYGLRVAFCDEVIQKLPGLFDHEVGDTMMLSVKATVISKRQTENQGGKSNKQIEIQITAMGADTGKADEKAFDAGAQK